MSILLDSLSQYTPNNFDCQYWNSLYKIKENDHKEALGCIQHLSRQAKNETQKNKAIYAFALYEASNGNASKAMHFLSSIKGVWVPNKKLLAAEPAFDSLRKSDEFIKYLESIN